MNKIANFHDNKELWLSERAKGITASDAPAILGLSPFKTPFQVWADKTQLLDNTFVESERMKWGQRLEAGIALGFAEETGIEVVQSGDLIAHPKHSWLMATPDFYGSDDSIIEVKNTGQYGAYANGETPDHVHIQLLIQLACSEKELGHIAALVQGSKLEHRIFMRELPLEEVIIAKLSEFKSLIDSRTAPALQSEDLGTVADLYKNSKDMSLDLNDSWLPTIEKYLELKEKIKGLESEKDQLEAFIKAHMKEAANAICGPYCLSWKTSERKGFTVAPTTMRKFSIKNLKTKKEK
jgi:putative phage-type endonuclease